MSEDSQQPAGSAVDRVVGQALARRYRNLSRRSFLSIVTRGAIRVAGVALAARILPYTVSTAVADSDCGLHGRHCVPPCVGGSEQLAWKMCCGVGADAGECPYYQCCSYIDQCGAYPPGCGLLGSGTAWCYSGNYICTVTSCMGFYQDVSQCTAYC